MSEMRVPEAVRRQAEQMEAFDAELAAAAAQPTGETPTPPTPPADPPPATPPEPTVDWQQKFLTLQGKYNAEVPQLRSQVANLTEQLGQLSTPSPTPAAAAPPPADPPPKLVTTEDTETYGDDLIDLIRRVAVETDAGEKAKLQGQIAELREQMAAQATQVKEVQGNVEGERRQQYFVDLAKACPTYETVDEDDAFKAWLLQTDDFSGIVRNDILQRAYLSYDVGQTAKIFNAFIAQATPEPPPVVDPPPNPQAELASQVSPGQARASAPVTTPDDGKKVWTVAEMDTFFKDVARGDYRGRRDEAARIEAEIDRALAEGRVR